MWSYGREMTIQPQKSWYLQNNPIKKNQALPEMAGCLILFLLISALYADFIKFFQNIINSCFFFFCSRFVHNGFALMHHQQAVSVVHCIAQIVGYHNGSQILFPYNAVCELHDGFCGF